jgi:anti-sigma factor RsiW
MKRDQNPIESDHEDVTASELVAFADDLLPPQRRSQVSAHLARDPAAAALARAFEQQTIELRAAFSSALDEPVPRRLIDMPAPPRAAPRALRMLAAAATLVLAFAGGWSVGDRGKSARALEEAPGRRALLAYQLFAAGPESMLDVPAAEVEGGWLRRTVGRSAPPSLRALGFELQGGRLMMGTTSSAALLVYQRMDHGAGHRVVVYLGQDDLQGEARTAPQALREGGRGAVFWGDGQRSVAVAGEVSLDELQRILALIS